MNNVKYCIVCGEAFVKRPQAIYCSHSCQQKAKTQRKNNYIKELETKVEKTELYKGCGGFYEICVFNDEATKVIVEYLKSCKLEIKAAYSVKEMSEREYKNYTNKIDGILFRVTSPTLYNEDYINSCEDKEAINFFRENGRRETKKFISKFKTAQEYLDSIDS